VFGYRGNDSLKADNDFTITLVRKRNLGPFNLLTPADNARITVRDNETTNVVITWQASSSATNYKWLIDLPSGNFSTPLAVIPADAGGTATTLTLTSGAISTLLGTAGVAKGDSINLKWTVRAIQAPVDSILANASFQIKAVRLKDLNIGLAEQELNAVSIYPNPVNDVLNLSSTSASSVILELLDMSGKVLSSTVLNQSLTIDMSGYAQGIYMLRLSSGDAVTYHKLFKNK
jgi:hypothetical protein